MHDKQSKIDTVNHIAALANLEFEPTEIEQFADEFDKILDYVSTIDSLNLDGVEPLSHVIETENVFREDVAAKSLSLEQALMNAPKRNESFFKVPKVLEKN